MGIQRTFVAIRRIFLVIMIIAAMIAMAVDSFGQTAVQALPPPLPLPVSEESVQQARDQVDGNYSPFLRGVIGGQIQTSWDRSEMLDGVFEYTVCETCTYKVRTRERMVTALHFPQGEKISGADIGDNTGFEVEVRSPRVIVVKPLGKGIDTSLLIYGESGAVYPVYLRAEGYNSVNVPDLLVRFTSASALDDYGKKQPDIIGFATDEVDVLEEPLEPLALPQENPTVVEEIAEALTTGEPEPGEADFIEHHPFDPDKLRGWGEYELEGHPDLEPVTVFRDDHFTYIRFGKKWTDLELPTAYVVVDDIDELVNTRVVGSTYIIESTRELITLKSGKAFLCIKYVGEEV